MDLGERGGHGGGTGSGGQDVIHERRENKNKQTKQWATGMKTDRNDRSYHVTAHWLG